MASTSHSGPKCSCGTYLHPKHKFCPSCGQQVRKNCDKCGATTDPKHIFCAHCGHRLVSEIPALKSRQAEIGRRIRQCDLKIASIQDTSNLYLGYQRQLEAQKV